MSLLGKSDFPPDEVPSGSEDRQTAPKHIPLPQMAPAETALRARDKHSRGDR